MLLLSTVLSSVQGVSVFENITSAISSILSGILLAEAPVITLEYGTFRGVADSVTGTDNFLGIVFIPLRTTSTHMIKGFHSALHLVSTSPICSTLPSQARKMPVIMVMLAHSKS